MNQVKKLLVIICSFILSGCFANINHSKNSEAVLEAIKINQQLSSVKNTYTEEELKKWNKEVFVVGSNASKINLTKSHFIKDAPNGSLIYFKKEALKGEKIISPNEAIVSDYSFYSFITPNKTNYYYLTGIYFLKSPFISFFVNGRAFIKEDKPFKYEDNGETLEAPKLIAIDVPSAYLNYLIEAQKFKNKYAKDYTSFLNSGINGR